MDVTPRELRDVEIREAFRGYNRDEVNDLLERAAVAIEALNERNRVLGERLASGAGTAQPAAASGRSETEDMLHRTLLLAQRASDEAIAEAEEKARVMIEEAETRSRRMLADAAIEARRTTETERRRLEQEIAELQNRRELLSTDVDGLEHFETAYRSRLMSAMEADLHAIERDLRVIRDRSDAAPTDRPELAEVDAPVPSASGPGAPSDSGATMEVDVRGFLDDKPRPLVGSGGPVPGAPGGEPISEAAQSAANEMVDATAPEATGDAEIASTSESTSEPATASAGSTSTSTSTGPATIDLFGEEQAIESSALDDDSFFRSLRDAVRDDAPAGPRDATERAFFDQDDKDSPQMREAFKRRR